MQMHCQPRDGHNPPRTEIYDLAKQCCLHTEQSNIFSPRLLQASLLIAMYEVGNAIYPAAYLTVGHCARLGHAMGINNTKDGPQMFSKPGSVSQILLITSPYDSCRIMGGGRGEASNLVGCYHARQVRLLINLHAMQKTPNL